MSDNQGGEDVLISEENPADVWALDEVLGHGGVGKVWKAHKKSNPDQGISPSNHTIIFFIKNFKCLILTTFVCADELQLRRSN